MKIIIHAFARKMKNGKENPKNYPYWRELVKELEDMGHTVIQVGLPDEEKYANDFRTVPLKQLKSLINTCDTWIGIDSFFQHLAWLQKKRGIVLFGPSNPKIFGHEENINLYVSDKYFRPDQFGIWECCEFNKDSFVPVSRVIESLKEFDSIQS